MGTEGRKTTEVEIFGTLYRVRADKDAEYLRELAEAVDRKMREIAEQTSTIDPARLAILGALNLADELFRCRRQQEGERVEIQEKVTALAEELGAALQA